MRNKHDEPHDFPLLLPGEIPREEESPQNIAVKIRKDSNCLGETECCWKPTHPLKGPTHSIVCFQALTLGSCRQKAAQEAPETYKERLNSVA